MADEVQTETSTTTEAPNRESAFSRPSATSDEDKSARMARAAAALDGTGAAPAASRRSARAEASAGANDAAGDDEAGTEDASGDAQESAEAAEKTPEELRKERNAARLEALKARSKLRKSEADVAAKGQRVSAEEARLRAIAADLERERADVAKQRSAIARFEANPVDYYASQGMDPGQKLLEFTENLKKLGTPDAKIEALTAQFLGDHKQLAEKLAAFEAKEAQREAAATVKQAETEFLAVAKTTCKLAPIVAAQNDVTMTQLAHQYADRLREEGRPYDYVAIAKAIEADAAALVDHIFGNLDDKTIEAYMSKRRNKNAAADTSKTKGATSNGARSESPRVQVTRRVETRAVGNDLAAATGSNKSGGRRTQKERLAEAAKFIF